MTHVLVYWKVHRPLSTYMCMWGGVGGERDRERKTLFQSFVSSVPESLRFDQFCDSIRDLFGSDIKNADLKAIYRKISTNPDAKVDWSEVQSSYIIIAINGYSHIN